MKGQFKFEMEKRKEMWKDLIEPLEESLVISPENRPLVVKDVVSDKCFVLLSQLLGIQEEDMALSSRCSVETMIPYIIRHTSSMTTDLDSPQQKSESSSKHSFSGSTSSMVYSENLLSKTIEKPSIDQTGRTLSEESSDSTNTMSDFVEVGKIRYPKEKHGFLTHKAVMKCLGQETLINKKAESTSEEKNIDIVNDITAEFCEWFRGLGGSEQTSISMDILKELFQVGMDYPAATAFCVTERELRVVYPNLSNFLRVPSRSVRHALIAQLCWDVKIEKSPSKIRAFGKHLPKELRFKSPKNKTFSTWFKWGRGTDELMNFTDVYKPVKDLHSTREYCRWLREHVKYKRPGYLEEQGMFDDSCRTTGTHSLKASYYNQLMTTVDETFLADIM